MSTTNVAESPQSTIPTVANAEAPASTVTTRGAQCRLIETYMSDAEKALSIATTEPDIRAALEAHGMDEADRGAALRLIAKLRDCFQARAKGMGAMTECHLDLSSGLQARRLEYQSFRDIARACFPQSFDRQALSVTDDIPDDPARLISVATASYRAAMDAAFQAKLSKRSYTPQRLETLLTSLAQLTVLAADKTDAKVSAQVHTAARDKAYQELRAFMKEWKGIARGALRTNPSALKKLGL